MTLLKPFFKKPELVLVATTPDDSHVWNLIGIQLKLEERGFRVENLGACTPLPELVAAIKQLRPSMLVLSSINGHGAISLRSVLAGLSEAGLLGTLLIAAGGLLTTDPAETGSAASQLYELGCDGVFTDEEAWSRFDAWLEELGVVHHSTKLSNESIVQRFQRKLRIDTWVKFLGVIKTRMSPSLLVGVNHGN